MNLGTKNGGQVLEEFDRLSPANLIRRGETGRLWASLFNLRYGLPD